MKPDLPPARLPALQDLQYTQKKKGTLCSALGKWSKCLAWLHLFNLQPSPSSVECFQLTACEDAFGTATWQSLIGIFNLFLLMRRRKKGSDGGRVEVGWGHIWIVFTSHIRTKIYSDMCDLAVRGSCQFCWTLSHRAVDFSSIFIDLYPATSRTSKTVC